MLKATTEIEINVPGARILSAEVLKNGTCKVVAKKFASEMIMTDVVKISEDVLELVETSKLSLDDKFMQYETVTINEYKLKKALTKAIRAGVQDFCIPKYAPSFSDATKRGIIYETGRMPAIGKSYKWWKKVAEKLMPWRNSRLGTKTEYVAFLGVLIKKLIEHGWTIKNAWNAVCNNSKELGHYADSENARNDLEVTGSREICRFCDLGNVFRILAWDELAEGFWIVGGRFGYNGDETPLSDMTLGDDIEDNLNVSVGFIVCNKIS